jgi:adenosine kinase
VDDDLRSRVNAMAAPRVVITGPLAFDDIYETSRPLDRSALSDQISVHGYSRHYGGVAGNVAVALAALGRPTVLLATIGHDGAAYVERLRDCGVETAWIEACDAPTSVWSNVVGPSGSQVGFFYDNGHAAATTVADLPACPETIVLVSPGSGEWMVRQATAARQCAARVVVDTGQRTPQLDVDELERLVECADVLVMNEYEAGILAARLAVEPTALAQKTSAVIVTRGHMGVSLFTEAGHELLPAVPVLDVVDTTGAGDAVRAGLIDGIAAGVPLPEAVRRGIECAARVLSCRGAQEAFAVSSARLMGVSA